MRSTSFLSLTLLCSALLVGNSASATCNGNTCVESLSTGNIQFREGDTAEITWCAYSALGEALETYIDISPVSTDKKYWLHPFPDNPDSDLVEVELKYFKEASKKGSKKAEYGKALNNDKEQPGCTESKNLKKLELKGKPGKKAQAGLYQAVLTIRNVSSDGSFIESDIVVTLGVDPLVRVSGLRDVSFSSSTLDSGDPDWFQDDQSICIFSSGKGDKYSVSVSGISPGPLLLKHSADSASIPYQVKLEQPDSKKSLTFINSSDNANETLKGSKEEICPVDKLTSLQVLVAKDDVRSALPGIYSDTLTLIVAPN